MYTYLLGWRQQDKWYYGSRTANILPPQDDLWHVYQTSSNYVKGFSKLHGPPDVIRVHKVFGNPKDTHDYEYRFLKKVDAKSNSRWLNQTIMGAPMGGSPGQIESARLPKSEEHKRKIGDANRGRKRPDARRNMEAYNLKVSSGQVVHSRTGKKHSPETIAKLREARAKQVMKPRGPMSAETKMKISEAKKKRPKII